MEVICDLDGRLEPGGSTRDADPIVVAQRLRDAQNRAAPRPQGPAERASSPDEAAGGTAGTWPTQLQVDARVAVLALRVSLKGGAVGSLLRLETAAASASRGVSCAFAKPEGQQRAAAPATVVAWPLRGADLSRGWGRLRSAPPSPPPRPGPRRTRSLIPRPPLPRRRPRRAGDALTASRWSPAEASAAHNEPRAAIPLPPSPARPARCGPHANAGWGVLRGRGPGGGGGHAPPCSLQAGSPHFSEGAPQIPAPEETVSPAQPAPALF